MGKILKYSVLRYSPSSIAGEKINLGILFSDEDSGYREFKFSRKFSRLSSFDDEVNIELVKNILQCIQDDVKSDKYDSGLFDIDQYIQYYINDYYFERVKAIKYDNLEDIVERLYKAFFRFDFEKDQRPSKADDRRLLEEIIGSKGKPFKRDRYVYGIFNDKVKYDIITDNYYIKLFDFDNKDLKRSINSAKAWAWNTMFCKDKETIIIYRYNSPSTANNEEFNIILRILKESTAKVYDIDSGIQFLQACV